MNPLTVLVNVVCDCHKFPIVILVEFVEISRICSLTCFVNLGVFRAAMIAFVVQFIGKITVSVCLCLRRDERVD